MYLATNSVITFCILLASSLLSLAAPVAPNAAIELLHEFSKDTFVENGVLLPNGSLIVSLLTEPTLYLLDPHRPRSPPRVFARLPGFNATVGLALPHPDTLAVTVGNILASNPAAGHNWAVVLLDLPHAGPPVVRATFPFPRGPALLDSVTPLPHAPDVLLVADSIGGRVYRLDTRTGALDIPFAGPIYEAPNPAPALPIGVNALRTTKDGATLYFTNSNRRTFDRVPLTPQGTPAGPSTTVAQLAPGDGLFDDFALAPDGEAAAYVADDASDEVRRVDLRDGKVSVVAGAPGDARLNHPTSVVYGGRERGRNVFYVTTAGRLFVGDESGGGQMVKVTLSRH